jgi:hypothetical protein
MQFLVRGTGTTLYLEVNVSTLVCTVLLDFYVTPLQYSIIASTLVRVDITVLIARRKLTLALLELTAINLVQLVLNTARNASLGIFVLSQPQYILNVRKVTIALLDLPIPLFVPLAISVVQTPQSL